jgi:hypothetical protein
MPWLACFALRCQGSTSPSSISLVAGNFVIDLLTRTRPEKAFHRPPSSPLVRAWALGPLEHGTSVKVDADIQYFYDTDDGNRLLLSNHVEPRSHHPDIQDAAWRVPKLVARRSPVAPIGK